MDRWDERAAELLPCIGQGWISDHEQMCPPELPSCYACLRRPVLAAELRLVGSCGVCGGTPPVSGRTCICGGSGLAVDEAQHARELLFKRELEIQFKI